MGFTTSAKQLNQLMTRLNGIVATALWEKRFKNRKKFDSYCKKVYPNLGHLEWSTVDFCLQITFGILFFIVRAIENPKNPKKVHPSIFDFV